MSLTSESTTVWNGDLLSGAGTVSLDSSQLATFDVNILRAAQLHLLTAINVEASE